MLFPSLEFRCCKGRTMDSAAVKETTAKETIIAQVAIVGEYQRRTQKGTGRTEKTVLSGAVQKTHTLIEGVQYHQKA